MAHARFAEAVERIAAAEPSERAERELALAQQALGIVEAFAAKEAAPSPDVHVYVPERAVTVEAPEVHVEVAAPDAPLVMPKIDVHLPEQAPPTVEVAAAPAPEVTVNVEAPKPRSVRVEEDPETGERRYVQE